MLVVRSRKLAGNPPHMVYWQLEDRYNTAQSFQRAQCARPYSGTRNNKRFSVLLMICGNRVVTRSESQSTHSLHEVQDSALAPLRLSFSDIHGFLCVVGLDRRPELYRRICIETLLASRPP